MSNKTRRKKKLFHAPQKKGELHRIPATKTNRIVSAVSLLLQTAMTAFGIWAVKNRYGQAGQVACGGMPAFFFWFSR